jgi:hypothetical protein
VKSHMERGNVVVMEVYQKPTLARALTVARNEEVTLFVLHGFLYFGGFPAESRLLTSIL